jgi:hypothetical protein
LNLLLAGLYREENCLCYALALSWYECGTWFLALVTEYRLRVVRTMLVEEENYITRSFIIFTSLNIISLLKLNKLN